MKLTAKTRRAIGTACIITGTILFLVPIACAITVHSFDPIIAYALFPFVIQRPRGYVSCFLAGLPAPMQQFLPPVQFPPRSLSHITISTRFL